MSIVGGITSAAEDVHDKCGDILSIVGVFSTVKEIMSTMGVILNNVGDTQYRIPHGTHDIPTLLITPTAPNTHYGVGNFSGVGGGESEKFEDQKFYLFSKNA